MLRAEYRPGRDGRPAAVRYPGAPDWLEVVPDGPRAVALRIGGLTYARAEATGADDDRHVRQRRDDGRAAAHERRPRSTR